MEETTAPAAHRTVTGRFIHRVAARGVVLTRIDAALHTLHRDRPRTHHISRQGVIEAPIDHAAETCVADLRSWKNTKIEFTARPRTSPDSLVVDFTAVDRRGHVVKGRTSFGSIPGGTGVTVEADVAGPWLLAKSFQRGLGTWMEQMNVRASRSIPGAEMC